MTTDEMVRIFRQHGEQRQRALIKRLARLGSSGLDLLAEICAGGHPPSVLRWAMEALGSYPGPKPLRLIQKGLTHPAMSVRLHAMLAVRMRNDPNEMRHLRPLLRDASGGIRVNALSIIAEFKPRWLRVELERALSDDKTYIRALAARLQSSS